MGFVQAAMGIVSLFGASKGAKAAKKAGRAEAALETRIMQEKVFQLGQQERQLAGETRAAAAGSGVSAKMGSPMDILAEQERTFDRERLFTQQVGAEKSALTMQRARNVAEQTMYSGITSALASFGGAAASTYGSSATGAKKFFSFG